MASRPGEKRDPKARPTQGDFTAATAVLCQLIPFAPTLELAQEVVAQTLARSIRTVGELDRLVALSARHLTRWEGVSGLLQVLERDNELAYIEREGAETHAKIQEWKREALPGAKDEITKQIAGAVNSKRLQ